MSLGEAWQGLLGSMNEEQSYKLLDAFADAGGNFIDTANGYQNEQSEEYIGRWMASRKNRDLMFLATKFTNNYVSHRLGFGKTVNYGGNHRKSLYLSVNDSLRKLQTDYIDLLYIHWWDWSTSIEEVMDALHILVQQGKVLYLGASDCPAWIVSAANTYAKSQGKTQFSVYQGRWSLMERDFERDIIPMARHFGMALCPWGVLGGAQLQTTKQLEERAKNHEGGRSAGQTEQARKVSAALEKIAEEHGIDSIQQIALAYVRQKAKNVNVIPLIGGRKVEHLQNNIAALSIRLTDEQISQIENIQEFDIGFPMNFISGDPRLGFQRSPLLESLVGAKIDYSI